MYKPDPLYHNYRHIFGGWGGGGEEVVTKQSCEETDEDKQRVGALCLAVQIRDPRANLIK